MLSCRIVCKISLLGTTLTGPASNVGKRASRSQHNTPPPVQPTTTFTLTQPVKSESPPSSPEATSRKSKNRKSAPATMTSNIPTIPLVEREPKKETKVFQNGVHAPHMLGNQLNPNSTMAAKMTDHLNSELEAHSIFNPADNSLNLTGPQLHSKVISSVRSTNTNTNTTNNTGLSGMLGSSGGSNVPQTLEQLLERQWEQGSQFLMEQAQHFDIASLLSCLHQLRAENLRLEEHVNSLIQRRDHLLAVNARLAIPLTQQQPITSQTHTSKF